MALLILRSAAGWLTATLLDACEFLGGGTATLLDACEFLEGGLAVTFSEAARLTAAGDVDRGRLGPEKYLRVTAPCVADAGTITGTNPPPGAHCQAYLATAPAACAGLKIGTGAVTAGTPQATGAA